MIHCCQPQFAILNYLSKCVFGLCSKCKTFSNIDKLEILSLKCSRSCFQKCTDCSIEAKGIAIVILKKNDFSETYNCLVPYEIYTIFPMDTRTNSSLSSSGTEKS